MQKLGIVARAARQDGGIGSCAAGGARLRELVATLRAQVRELQAQLGARQTQQ